MNAINAMLNDFGFIFAYFMAFLIVIALIVVICNFFKIVIKWYKIRRF